MRGVAGLVLALLAGGCFVHREYDRNAPGIADVAAPPRMRLEVPRDPGRHGVLLSGGVLGGGGLEAREAGRTGVGQLQLELSAAYFSNDFSDADGYASLPPLTGVNLGLTLLGTGVARRALYLEAQYSSALLGAAAGWSYDPVTQGHGPQATLFYGPVYARLGWRLGDGGEAIFGLALKGYAKLSWFR
jgi:hypothetical protein